MPGKGLGRDVGSGLDMLGPDSLIPDCDVDSSAAVAVLDWHWWGGTVPPRPVDIPVAWLSPPLRVRQDHPLNRAEVGQRGGATARSTNVPALNDQQWLFTASVDSVADADAPNLATWVTDTYDEPLPRCGALTLVLNVRTDTEVWRILGVTQGRRIRLTDAPGSWPTGATELVVEGVTHQFTGDLRIVQWNTSPVIGAAAGVAGPWFRYSTSRWNGTDVRPY